MVRCVSRSEGSPATNKISVINTKLTLQVNASISRIVANINEQISTVNTLYPQIDPNVLKASDVPPCEHKKHNIYHEFTVKI